MDAERLEGSRVASGYKNGSATLEDKWVVSHKVKHTLTTRPNHPTLKKWNETLRSHKTCTCIDSSSNHHHPKPETTQMSLSSGMNKETVVCPYDAIKLSNKKELSMHTADLEESQGHYYAKWKKPVSGDTPYDFICSGVRGWWRVWY